MLFDSFRLSKRPIHTSVPYVSFRKHFLSSLLKMIPNLGLKNYNLLLCKFIDMLCVGFQPRAAKWQSNLMFLKDLIDLHHSLTHVRRCNCEKFLFFLKGGAIVQSFRSLLFA